jgi:pimeloyl-ACP methyl ester carboxylesterase
MRELAGKGLFVVVIDAHLHGERKVPGIFPKGKSLGALGDDYSIWVHQSAISHTARDVSRVLDALSARPEVDLSRVGVGGVSMGSSTCLVLAWKEPRISVVVGLIGAVDFWYDVTKTPPGPGQDAKRKGLSLRVRQLVNGNDPLDRKAAIAPKALFLANGAKDQIDIESIKQFVKDLQPSYKAHPDRLKLLEEPKTGHSVTDRMWDQGIQWFVHHLVEKPLQAPGQEKDARQPSDTEFEKLHRMIKPQAGEARWMEITWYPNIWEARQRAAAEGKPLFIWAGSGGAPAAGC